MVMMSLSKESHKVISCAAARGEDLQDGFNARFVRARPLQQHSERGYLQSAAGVFSGKTLERIARGSPMLWCFARSVVSKKFSNFGQLENITRPESDDRKIGFPEFVPGFENSCLPDA